MRAVDARAIPISQFLEYQGLKPDRTRQDGRELWYSSPIRSGDKTPSFKVDTQLNVWFDHGLGQGGTLIDLVCELKSVTVAEALAILDATGLGPTPQQRTDAPRLFGMARPAGRSVAGEKEKTGQGSETNAAFQILKVCDIKHPALADYLNSRAIDLDIAHRYLRQVHFRPASGVGQFFGLGFPCGEGFDVRSAVFKGFVGTGKDISVIEGQGSDRHSVAIFEGFMDFLSLLTHRATDALKEDAIILHSIALKRRAVVEIKAGNYNHVRLHLDHDDAGRATTNFFLAETGREITTDESDMFSGYKDINEWLVARHE